MNQADLIERGNKLSKKYTIDELKDALRNAVSNNDHLERLALQWALKNKTKEKDGYKFTIEQKDKIKTKLKLIN